MPQPPFAVQKRISPAPTRTLPESFTLCGATVALPVSGRVEAGTDLTAATFGDSDMLELRGMIDLMITIKGTKPM
jgi:hypothetical protein